MEVIASCSTPCVAVRGSAAETGLVVRADASRGGAPWGCVVAWADVDGRKRAGRARPATLAAKRGESSEIERAGRPVRYRYPVCARWERRRDRRGCRGRPPRGGRCERGRASSRRRGWNPSSRRCPARFGTNKRSTRALLRRLPRSRPGSARFRCRRRAVAAAHPKAARGSPRRREQRTTPAGRTRVEARPRRRWDVRTGRG